MQYNVFTIFSIFSSLDPMIGFNIDKLIAVHGWNIQWPLFEV